MAAGRIASDSSAVCSAVRPVLGDSPTPRNSSRMVAISGACTWGGSGTSTDRAPAAVTSRSGLGAKVAKLSTPWVPTTTVWSRESGDPNAQEPVARTSPNLHVAATAWSPS